jgi:signal transduction histidine kinase/CheY-like chemotaxis protein
MDQPNRPGEQPNTNEMQMISSSSAKTDLSALDESILRKALDRGAGPFVVYADNHRVVYANDMARQLWPMTIGGVESGLSMHEATANQIRSLVPTLPEDDIQAVNVQTLSFHNSRKPNEVMAEGGRWFRIFHDKVQGEFICIMGVEITELKAREAELDAARLLAEKAHADKSDFLARMSHEIKTPLNAIVGMSDALLEDVNDPEVRETLEYIMTAADGLNHVLGQTLDHAKLVSQDIIVEPQSEDYAHTVRQVVGAWKKKCESKGLELKLNLHENLPATLVFDRFRFQQCLNNLMSNAVKFTETGQISVVTKFVQKPGKPACIALVVKDTGVGIREEEREHIFVPFQQANKSTKRIFGGTGLGLSITKQLIEAMGGSISVLSELGEGTAFVLTLPTDLEIMDDPLLAFIPPEPANQITEVGCDPRIADGNIDLTDPQNPHAAFSGLSVLCVEDNPVNHKVINKLIGKHVKSLIFAENGQEGLRLLDHHKIDVVLMDIHMPVMDGVEATLKIRASEKPWANVIIIAVTADPDFQYQRVCRNIGMNDAIGKPVRRQDILDSVARSLDGLKDTHARMVSLPIAV